MDAFVVAPAHGEAHPFDSDRRVRLGMLFYVLTDVTFSVFLLVTYVWLRGYNTGGGWFPLKEQVPDQGTSVVLVALIVVSAVSFFVAYRGIAAGNQTILRAGLTLALVLLVATLVEQIRFMGQQQFSAADGSFASTFIVLSGYHIYHLCFGLFFGLGLTIRAFRGFYSRERHLGLITVGYFWYWMALYPVVVLLMMTLLPPRI